MSNPNIPSSPDTPRRLPDLGRLAVLVAITPGMMLRIEQGPNAPNKNPESGISRKNPETEPELDSDG